MSVAYEEDVDGMLSDLRADLMGLLPLPTALVTYYALLFTENVFGLHGPAIPAIGAGVITACIAAQWLKHRRVALAALVYLAGVACAALSLIAIAYSPLSVALFPSVILLTMAILGTRSMAVMTMLGVAVALSSAGRHGQLDKTVIAPVAVLGLTAIVAWLSHRNLTTAVEWAWASYQQARTSTEEARQRRGELARTLKALDEAYYRLERFSGQLAQAREAAEEARRAKQQFVATVSHELRTPLNVIIGFAELMTLSPESYGVRGVPRPFIGDVNRIYRSAQHLKGLIDDVLDLSQVDARRMLLLNEPAVLSEVIAEAADMVWSLAAQKGLHLTVDVPESFPLVSLDRLRIRQVLLNLLSNAIRFTDAGGITVSAQMVESEVQVTVADTGRGIAPEDLGRVFEEFHQIDGSLGRAHQGTGLGLALSRRFVLLHGGRMWVESQLGRGSRFHFTLPTIPPAETEAAAGFTALPLPPGVQAQGAPLVLVTGLEPMAVSLLRRHLRGYRILTTPQSELLEAVETHLPRAVIRNGMTLDMAESYNAVLPVPSITCPLPDSAYLGHMLGVDHYVVKPVTRERLLDILAFYGERVRRVLIVDDDAQLAELMARMVRAAPGVYAVDVACGGEEGWTRMQEWRPDLVLLDLVMEGLDGLAILKLMRADTQLRSVPVVVITAHDMPGGEDRLPGISRITVDGLQTPTVTDMLNCLQAILDSLPPAPTASSPPPRPGADPPALPAS